MTPKERFINACLNKEVDRPPVWLMRQAGRYLPEYRNVRAFHSTKKMMTTPEVACDVTLQPVAILGVDAAILYSDILMIPDAMGMGLTFTSGKGPVFERPVRDQEGLNQLKTRDLTQRLDFVFKSAKLCAKKLGDDYPLIGFAGAPWTVASYMVSGGAGGDFSALPLLARRSPQTFSALMELLVQATTNYLIEQVNAGACAVQLFDSWALLLSPEEYASLVVPHTRKIFQTLKTHYIPSIYFVRGGLPHLRHAATLPCDVLSVDWTVPLKGARELSEAHALQGNFDPELLLTTPSLIKKRLQEMVAEVNRPHRGYIINLGHGIRPDTPVQNVRFFVEEAKKAGRGI